MQTALYTIAAVVSPELKAAAMLWQDCIMSGQILALVRDVSWEISSTMRIYEFGRPATKCKNTHEPIKLCSDKMCAPNLM